MSRESFDQYELRKALEARSADISPLVTERDQAGDAFAVIGNAWSRSMFGGLFYVSPPASRDLPSANLVFRAIARRQHGHARPGVVRRRPGRQARHLRRAVARTNSGGEPGTPLYDKPLHGREVVRKNGTGADAGVVFEHISLNGISDFRGQISD
jgi:hypothetical protein